MNGITIILIIIYNMILMLTGQPGSGKTTIAKELIKDSINTVILDGDMLRVMFNNYDYTKIGREINFNNLLLLIKVFDEMGYNIIIAMVLPYQKLRNIIKSLYETIEIFLSTSEIRGKENFHVLNYEKSINNYTEIDTTDISIENVIKLIKLEYK